MSIIPDSPASGAIFALTDSHALVGLTDYALDLARLAARHDAVTPDGAHAAAFVTALQDFARRYNLNLADATRELHLWLNQRDDVTRLCVAATFGGV